MNTDLMFSSGSNEHYTPIDLLFRICDFYGGWIDLDPCSNDQLFCNTPASIHYTKENDGLTLPWFGDVFVNPPYGRSLMEWVDAILDKQDEYNQLLFLVPSRTDTRWYSKLTHLPRLNFKGRLKFYNPKNKSGAPFPSVMFYIGDQPYKFKNHFQSLGEIIIPSFDKKAYHREYMKQRRAKLKLNSNPN